MHKQAQITLFIIIGIVLLSGVLLIIVVNQYSNTKSLAQKQISSSKDFSDVEMYVKSCLNGASLDALWEISRNGGRTQDQFINTYRSVLSSDGNLVPVYLENRDSYLPETIDLQDNLEIEINKRLLQCLDFSTFESEGYTVKEINYPSTQVIINEEGVTVNLAYEIEVSKGASKKGFDKFSATFPISIKKMLEKTNVFVNNVKSAVGVSYDITTDCISYDLNVYRKGNGVVQFIDAYTPIRNKDQTPLVFQFAIVGVNLLGGCSG